MTMENRRRAPRNRGDKRQCAVCFLHISEKRPVYLVTSGDGRILGPYHASCGAWLTEEARKGKENPAAAGSEVGRMEIVGRQEELPW